MAEPDGAELEVLRAGVRLMALRALNNADLADEVAQETIARAFHSLRSSRPDNLGAFVAGIARHVIADHLRGRSREIALEDLAPGSEPQTVGDPLAMLCDASEAARVRDALVLLSPEDQRLLQLVYFEGLTPSEIARRDGVPPERIRQRKLRALEHLRRAFASSAEPRHETSAGATVGSAAIGGLEPSRSLK